MIRINEIIDKITENHPGADVEIVMRAYVFSAKVHDGQVRLSGEPYLTHPLEVAGILADMKLGPISIAAGLLHDVIEDTQTSEEEIKEIFGEQICHIVAGVSKITTLSIPDSQIRQAENMRKMLLAMADDIRVILIKLADRIHNMRTLQFHKTEEKKKKIAKETLDIYAPIASRLGIYWIKTELEDTSFKYLLPEEYEKVRDWIQITKEERETYIEKIRSEIHKKLALVNLSGEVLGRYKHFYSIYQKMKTQNLQIEDVYDIIAFRIILENQSQCYEVLGHIHSRWKPIDNKFKDYIARPKPNMYQSLHTTVMGDNGERIEIQIRTNEMDQVAKSGIAAHWGYKEGKNIDENIVKQFAWIQNLIENQENVDDPDEFMENVRIDLFPDEVYAFTPQGEIKALTKGATPIDFAYAVHSEVGHQCIGAKVNGRLVPLKYELQTGDTIDIITSRDNRPSKDWLNFVKTAKARSRIRQWIKKQEKERSVTLGREMCEKAFRKYQLNFNTFSKSDEFAEVIQHFGFKTMEDLVASVGYGKITPLQLVRKCLPKTEEETDEFCALNKSCNQKEQKKKSIAGVVVKGVDDILVRFAKCCQPLPGDAITGYITRGHGVTVHRSNCVNVLKVSPDRKIDVEWNIESGELYSVDIRILSHDRVGLLADVTGYISKNGANIISAQSKVRDNRMVDTHFTLSVKNKKHLNKVMMDIKKVKRILEVKRIGG